MPESRGRFGIHGGQYIPETLMNACIELEDAYNHYKDDPEFRSELSDLLGNYANRPSLLYYAKNMTEDLGGAKIYLKREDLNHTGAHKINNALGQCLLAKKMGKTRVIAETGAGQHGVATATAAALLGMECVVFMGKVDTERQALNVYRMKLLGASVVPVTTGTATLKDAVSQAMREWTSRIADTHYCIGSCMGPHPFPTIVRDFQAVISEEARAQILEKEGRLPDTVIACVGGGSNAIGSFYHFIGDKDVKLIGCEAAGRGIHTSETAATISTGRIGIFHGMKSYFCQDKYGQIAPVYSISAGLDYPGVGPEHAYLHDIGRAQYAAITDEEAVQAFEYCSRKEGIIPAVESAHAVAYAMKLAPAMRKDQIIIVTLSGRGDKDVAAIARYRGENLYDATFKLQHGTSAQRTYRLRIRQNRIRGFASARYSFESGVDTPLSNCSTARPHSGRTGCAFGKTAFAVLPQRGIRLKVASIRHFQTAATARPHSGRTGCAFSKTAFAVLPQRGIKMSRISKAFDHGKAFIAFITCGDPDLRRPRS